MRDKLNGWKRAYCRGFESIGQAAPGQEMALNGMAKDGRKTAGRTADYQGTRKNLKQGIITPRVSLEQYEENLKWMAEQLRRNGIKVVLMTSEPVRWTDKLKELYCNPPYKVNDPLGFEQAALIEYNQVVRKLAAERDLQTCVVLSFCLLDGLQS